MSLEFSQKKKQGGKPAPLPKKVASFFQALLTRGPLRRGAEMPRVSCLKKVGEKEKKGRKTDRPAKKGNGFFFVFFDFA